MEFSDVFFFFQEYEAEIGSHRYALIGDAYFIIIIIWIITNNTYMMRGARPFQKNLYKLALVNYCKVKKNKN